MVQIPLKIVGAVIPPAAVQGPNAGAAPYKTDASHGQEGRFVGGRRVKAAVPGAICLQAARRC